MATVLEIIGLSPMNTAMVPQVDTRKHAVADYCGRVILEAVKNDLKPRDICTRHAF